MKIDRKSFLSSVTNKPGAYQMLSEEGQVLYVGKARNLKKRLSTYFQQNRLDPKTEQLMQLVAHIQVTATASETEALLLEYNLIQEFKPKFNILLRDDKSYPYLFLSADEFPRLDLHRGAQNQKGQYFGPYPSAGAVRETLILLQKLFRLRQCRNTFFQARTRPCLQYQIKRCTAPCVNYISPEAYAEQVQDAKLFLQGKDQQIMQNLQEKMENASEARDYEQAAFYRDQIAKLRRVQESQIISGERGDTDVVAVEFSSGTSCVHVLTIRQGRLMGSKSFFPKMPHDSSGEEVLMAFLSQYYLNAIRSEQIPKEIIVNISLPEAEWLAEMLSSALHKNIKILHHVRTQRAGWLKMAVDNAALALTSHLSDKASMYRRFEALQQLLQLENIPQRLECFDISHSSGEATVASCVVFEHHGPVKTDYRRFNIKDITPGDDYAAIRQAVLRRYTKVKSGEGKLPDILFIDGGKGQLHEAEKALEECQLSSTMLVVSIAKGPERKAGAEVLWLSGGKQCLQPGPHHEALHLIQQIRDESHRFAISGHRARRDKQRVTSSLEEIEGVGPKLKQRILKHFGGLQEVRRASVEELCKVPGVHQKIAERIFAAYR